MLTRGEDHFVRRDMTISETSTLGSHPPDRNPIRIRRLFDFVLDGKPSNPIKEKRKAVNARPGERGNRLALEVLSPDFLLEVDGIETRRGDLVIRTSEITADDADEGQADESDVVEVAEVTA